MPRYFVGGFTRQCQQETYMLCQLWILTPAISHRQACLSTYLCQRIESTMTELRNTPLPTLFSSKETDIDSLSIKCEDMTYIMI